MTWPDNAKKIKRFLRVPKGGAFARRSPGLPPSPTCRKGETSRLNLALDHLQLKLGNGLGRIEALRTSFGAVQDGVATIEPERVFEIVESLAGGFIA